MSSTIAAPDQVQEIPKSVSAPTAAPDLALNTALGETDSRITVRRLWPAVEILYVSGLALLCLFVANLLLVRVAHLRQGEEAFEWGIYLFMGTIFPALVLMLALGSHLMRGKPARALAYVKVLLVFFLGIAATYLVVKQSHQNIFFYGIIAVLSAVQLFLSRKSLRDAAGRISRSSVAINLLIVGLSWLCAVPYLWWRGFEANILVSLSGALVIGPALFLVVSNVFSAQSTATSIRPAVRTVLGACADAIALLLIAAASSRFDILFDDASFHHWGVYVGPAQMVRQGEWLLWDVPSQYGFLSILMIARFPGLSALNEWQALYILNAVALCFVASVIYFVLRALRPGITCRCFALLVALAAVFWIYGGTEQIAGPHVTPSIGGYRFLWYYALLAILLWHFQRPVTMRNLRNTILVGCGVWVLGILWSFESAVYCTAIWFPAALVLIGDRALSLRVERASGPVIARMIAGSLLLPITLLAFALGVIEAFYRVRLGHGPDWLAYIEYTISFSGGGFGSLPINPHGPVWTLLLVFFALATTIAQLIRTGTVGNQGALALTVGAWGGLWATSSYYIGRSHDNNATNLAPIVYVTIGLLLLVLSRTAERGRWKMVVRTALVPPLIILLLATVGGSAFWVNYLPSAQVGYQPHIERQLPLMQQAQRDLLNEAHLGADDYLIVLEGPLRTGDIAAINLPQAWATDGTNGELVSSTRTWLPVHPWAAMVPLTEERQRTYMARYIERTHLSGWLMQPKSSPYTNFAGFSWFADQLQQTHQPTAVYENGDWELIRFDLRTSTAPVPQAGNTTMTGLVTIAWQP